MILERAKLGEWSKGEREQDYRSKVTNDTLVAVSSNLTSQSPVYEGKVYMDKRGWKPIETAPKDGTWVLVYGEGIVSGEDDPRNIAVAQYTDYLNGGKTRPHWQFAWYDGGVLWKP